MNIHIPLALYEQYPILRLVLKVTAHVRVCEYRFYDMKSLLGVDAEQCFVVLYGNTMAVSSSNIYFSQTAGEFYIQENMGDFDPPSD